VCVCVCVCVCVDEYREKLKMIRIHGRDSHDLDFKIFLAISDDKVPH
jgi:hypothetical protein